MNPLRTQLDRLFNLGRLLIVDTTCRDSSGEMDRGALLRRYHKEDLLLKPAPRLLAEPLPSIALPRIRIRKTCGGSLGDACQAPLSLPRLQVSHDLV
jgi:hypothetical protein